MKKILSSLLIILSFKIFSLNSTSNQVKIVYSGFDSLEVFISIGEHDNEVYSVVKSALSIGHGISPFAYCDNHGVFMVYIDKNVWRSADDFLAEVKTNATVYASKLSLKEGQFKDLMLFCNTTDPQEAAAIKER